MESIRRDEQNLEIVSKTEKIDFSAKFAWKLKFHGNQGKFSLTQWFYVAIKSMRGIKIWIFHL